MRKMPLPGRCVAPALMVLAALLLWANPADADLQVWTVAETRRVLRTDKPGKTRDVDLAAAGREWESFQILLRSDAPVEGITIQPGDLEGPDGSVLRAEDARLFRQHQLHIRTGSHRNESFQPGWYPDALIPFTHPLTRAPLDEARFDAVPFRLPAGETHGFLVDVRVPANVAAGEYRGTYMIKAKGHQTVQVPVRLTVWDFDLPRVSTMVAQLGWPANRMRRYYRNLAKKGKTREPADWSAIETQCSAMLTRHRINCWPPDRLRPQPSGEQFVIPKDQIDTFRRYVDRYHVNAYRVPRPPVDDPEAQHEKLEKWMESWDRAAKELNRPQVLFYMYLTDEPNDEEEYEFVQRWGRAIRKCNSVVQVMVTEQTWPQKKEWGDLYGAIDIWCPLYCLFKPDSAAKRREKGESLWTYTALCQGSKTTPWWQTDFPLLHYRVPAWISWRYRIRGQLYWGGMAYWRGVEDPWTDPDTYHESLTFNGEGMLVYPGRAAGYEGIAPSLRLKAFRDGLEDYEYMAILERAGLAEEAEQVVRRLAASWYEWEKDPEAYRKARAKLARMITEAVN